MQANEEYKVMLFNHDKQTLYDFYDSLNENQRRKVENKLDKILSKTDKTRLDERQVHVMRCQIASDLFYILKG